MRFRRFVIVTGLSGAGKSQAMKSFEDLGFHCLDNLPPRLVLSLVTLCEEAGVERLALALDVRTHGPFGEVQDAIEELTRRDIAYDLLFLDATDEALVRRYSETRRRHPFEASGVLGSAITAERTALADVRARAGRIWDTSGMTHAMLKARISATFAERCRRTASGCARRRLWIQVWYPARRRSGVRRAFLTQSELRAGVARTHWQR